MQRQARERKHAEQISFNRRELREAFKWGDTRLRTHLDELVEMEYAAAALGPQRADLSIPPALRAGPGRARAGRFLAGLKSVEQLRQEANLAGVLTHLAAQKRPPRTHLAGGKPRGSKRQQTPMNKGL